MNNLYKFVLLLTGLTFSTTNMVQAVNEYYVYADKFENGSPSGIMGSANGSSLLIDPSCKENPFKGENCLKITASGAEAWSGLFIQKGGGWREGIDPLVPLADLSKKRFLVFSARSDKNYTIAKLGMGEGKEASKGEAGIALTSRWQRFVYELPTKDMERINGLFLVVFENGGTIYLDEVFYAEEDFVPQSSDIVYKERKEPLDPTSFYVYADKFENGVPMGYMGDKNGQSLKLDDNCRINPYMGTKCIKIVTDNSEEWRGLYICYSGVWNAALTENSKLVDLSAYDKLEFYARSDAKPSDPYIFKEIGVGAGDKYEDHRSETYLEVGPTWKKYTINLKGMNLKTTNSLLMMVLPVGTVYLDEIRYLRKKEK
jgi:hypothetical protein